MQDRKQVLGKGAATQTVGEALYRRDEMEKSLKDNGLDLSYYLTL